MKLLHGAIDDLERALLYFEKEREEDGQQRQSSKDKNSSSDRNANSKIKNKNNGIKKQCQRSLDRLQKERNREEKRQEKIKAKLFHNKLQSQQKRDVLRLLLARYNNGKVRPGEAFFLLEWNWWVRWCRHVDFFDNAADSTKKCADTQAKDDRTVERTQHLLNYFLTGATLPLRFRTDPRDDEDDDSSDEEDEDDSVTLMAPGPIDNSELLVQPDDIFLRQWYLPHLSSDEISSELDGDDLIASSLKPNLIRGYHYEILPREVYNALRTWFGELTPSICRRITVNGNLMIHPNQLSKLAISSLKSQRCNACQAPGANSRCQQCMTVQYCDRACQESHWKFHLRHCRPIRVEKSTEHSQPSYLPHIPLPSEGRHNVGLNNLGNTCFMNSALQSLSHATPLTRHFLSNRFKFDLNTSNPLGTGGKLALAYEEFLKHVWMKQGITSTSPTALKRAIALFAPRFAGYQQHDAQEFLAYLLDGLHEDLNRIRRAPYVEMPDVTDAQNMTIAAAEAWDAHKRRNHSIVRETFYGQFQSTCVCPRCDRVSVSFETFNHVSLEIPSNRTASTTIVMPILVHFANGKRKPVYYGVTVQRSGFISDLKNAVANTSQLDANRLVLTDVYENSIYKLLDDKQSLSTINPNEDTIVAYEVTPYAVKDTLHMIVSHALVVESGSKNENDEKEGMTGDEDENVGNAILNDINLEHKAIGLPFMTSIDAKSSTCHDLWEFICVFAGRITQCSREHTEDTMGGIQDDSAEKTNNCRIEDILSIHIVDAQGQPRCLFATADGNTKTNILPKDANELLSTFLGDGCAEDFLFLTLIWNFPTMNEEKKFVINPNLFLDFDRHSTFLKATEQQAMNTATTEQGITLQQCFQSFSRPERLDVDNMWYCSKCKQHVQALKTMKLWRLPNILVIHLKRFEFRNALRRDKLGTLVDFPLAGLDMNPHCAHFKSTEDNPSSNFGEINAPADYDLFAVVNHYGRLGFGHYTAFAMQWDETGISKRWNAFDDSTVRPIQHSEIKSSAAYILFYRRRVFQ